MARLTLPLLLSVLTLLSILASAAVLKPEVISGEHIGTTVQQLSQQLETGSVPRIVEEPKHVLQTRRHHHKHQKGSSGSPTVYGGKVTYYAGGQLANPACGGPTPNDRSMIAAISFDSPFQCGDKIRITAENGKETIVTAVDRCAGCDHNWIDVTKGVFQTFSGLDTGVLHNVKLTKV